MAVTVIFLMLILLLSILFHLKNKIFKGKEKIPRGDKKHLFPSGLYSRYRNLTCSALARGLYHRYGISPFPKDIYYVFS
jgi:hypothetical protein